MGIVGGGIGGVIVLVLALFFGVAPGTLIDDTNTSTDASRPPDDEAKDFVSAVVGYTEDTWKTVFESENRTYRPPTLVLLTGAVQSPCGFAQSAMGPFYCPNDQKVYLDMSFFHELKTRFGAPGDFAQAYVIAHEVGHHVQHLLGINPGRGNEGSVRLELQADCFAGVWANRTEQNERLKVQKFLDKGDVEEALAAASAVGDDRIQAQTRGHVTPDSFTHGSAAQRAQAFRTGLERGSIQSCNAAR